MKTTFKKPLTLTALALSGLVLAGCGGAKYVDSTGPETIVSTDQIDIQDWSIAADALVASLLRSGVLERAPQQPSVMAISRIVNNTTEQVDTDLLTRKIRIALNQSGRVLTTTTVGYRDTLEDPLAAEQSARAGVPDDQGRPIPFYTLSGRLIESRSTAGKVRQVTYSFQLALTEVRTGLAVWEGEEQITKQGKKSSVGW